MKRRPPGSIDCVVPWGRAFSCSLLPGCYLGLLGFNALWAVEHHLNHSVLHQRGKSKEQASNEPNVDSLDVGHFGQLGSQGSALGGQREHWEDACIKQTNQGLAIVSNIWLICYFVPLFFIPSWYVAYKIFLRDRSCEGKSSKLHQKKKNLKEMAALQWMSASPWQPAISSTVGF